MGQVKALLRILRGRLFVCLYMAWNYEKINHKTRIETEKNLLTDEKREERRTYIQGNTETQYERE